MILIRLLGVYEDVFQRDFHLGLVKCAVEALGLEVEVVNRLTRGCRPDVLAEHFAEPQNRAGVIVGIDASTGRKRCSVSRLIGFLEKRGVSLGVTPVLWSIADPCIEEWMMADASAMRQTIEQELQTATGNIKRPTKARSEAAAKKRLLDWVEELAGGNVILRSGAEYAFQVGYRVRPERIDNRRNRELRRLMVTDLPQFLRKCNRQ